MHPVLRDSVFVSVEQVDLRMGGKIVLHQHFRQLIRFSVIVTGNNDIRRFVILREQMIFEMRIADDFRGELLSFCVVPGPDLLRQSLFMGKVPVIVSSDCHVRRTPLLTVYILYNCTE